DIAPPEGLARGGATRLRAARHLGLLLGDARGPAWTVGLTGQPRTSAQSSHCMTATLQAPPKMSTVDRYLAVWIGLAMVAGLALGRWVPGLNTALDAVQIGGVSVPIAIGLLVMMYPVLAKVRYDRLDTVTGDRRLMASSLVLNWR